MSARPLPEQRRRRSITKADRERFLEALAAGWAVRHAASLTGVGFQRWYQLRDQDETFARDWTDAHEQGGQALLDEARRRAVEGFDEDTYDGEGKLIRRVHRYDSQLLQTLLKLHFPELRNAPAVEVNAPAVSLQVPADYQPATLGDLVRLARELGVDDVIEGEATEEPALELEAAG